MVFVLQLMTFFGINILNSPLFRDLSTQFIPPDFPLTQSIFDMIAAIAPWQPPFVIGTCGGGAGWQSFLSLGIITLIALLAALFRFQRLDLP